MIIIIIITIKKPDSLIEGARGRPSRGQGGSGWAPTRGAAAPGDSRETASSMDGWSGGSSPRRPPNLPPPPRGRRAAGAPRRAAERRAAAAPAAGPGGRGPTPGARTVSPSVAEPRDAPPVARRDPRSPPNPRRSRQHRGGGKRGRGGVGVRPGEGKHRRKSDREKWGNEEKRSVSRRGRHEAATDRPPKPKRAPKLTPCANLLSKDRGLEIYTEQKQWRIFF